MTASTAISTSKDTSSAEDGKSHAELELARLLVNRLNTAGERSTAEMLNELRQAFPDAPLSVRVAALAMLTARKSSSHT